MPPMPVAFPGAAHKSANFLLGRRAAGAGGGRLATSWAPVSAASVAGGGVGVEGRRPSIPSLECSVHNSFAAKAAERGVGTSPKTPGARTRCGDPLGVTPRGDSGAPVALLGVHLRPPIAALAAALPGTVAPGMAGVGMEGAAPPLEAGGGLHGTAFNERSMRILSGIWLSGLLHPIGAAGGQLASWARGEAGWKKRLWVWAASSTISVLVASAFCSRHGRQGLLCVSTASSSFQSVEMTSGMAGSFTESVASEAECDSVSAVSASLLQCVSPSQ